MMIVTERNGLDTEFQTWTSSQDSNFGFWRKDLNLDAVPNFRRLPETWTSALNFEFGNLPGFALWLWKIRLEFTKFLTQEFTTFNTFKFRIHPGDSFTRLILGSRKVDIINSLGEDSQS
ncbi:unnamed protein product [Rhizophagus irregularis]|nr:unnamed protein product [Rhizophagus irregularis]